MVYQRHQIFVVEIILRQLTISTREEEDNKQFLISRSHSLLGKSDGVKIGGVPVLPTLDLVKSCLLISRITRRILEALSCSKSILIYNY